MRTQRFANEGHVAQLALKTRVRRDIAFRRNCLLVEDSDFDQHRVSRMLKSVAAVELTIENSLAGAQEALHLGKFDLILLDNALPDGLGVDFALELRKSDKHKQVPIMIVSDFPSPFMYDKALMARVSRVVTKSELRPDHLRKVLEKT